ncbi:MAG TPA: SpoIIE family protein phosphatase [Polyangiaceae bacterium]
MAPPFLLISRGDTSARVYPLNNQRYVIGRRPDAEIVIDHMAVSWTHASLESGPSGGWWILDLGSTNGTLVNGVRVTERLLNIGDVVRIADCSLVLRPASAFARPSQLGEEQPGACRAEKQTADGNERTVTITQSLQPPVIQAERLASIMHFGRTLMRLEGAETRLWALCEFVASDPWSACGAAVLRIDQSGKVRQLCATSIGGKGRVVADVSPNAIRALLSTRRSMILRAGEDSGPTSRLRVGMLIPYAESDACIDALHVEFPLLYGTEEWLMLFTMIAEAYQQAELVWDMRHQVRQNALVEGELEMACQIQVGWVPSQFFTPGLELAFEFEPCRWVGGDYVDALVLPDGRVLLAIADVCGKGLHAALVASSVQTLVRASRDIGGDLPVLMKRLNEYLLGHLPEHSFVTMLCIVLDCKTGEFEMVNAGHPAPVIIRCRSCAEVVSQTDNVGLGIAPDNFVKLTNKLDGDDVLLMYTDGVTEMVNMKNETFGGERLVNEFQRIVQVNREASVDAMRQRLTDLCSTYRGTRMANDDWTFLVAMRRMNETMRPQVYGALD